MTDPISRIEAALARLGAEHEPPQGWEAKVLAATVDRRRSRWWWWLTPLPVAAVAALVLVLLRPVPVNPWMSLLSTPGVEAHGERVELRRGERSLSRGDVLTARATHDQVHGALWIYRDGQLEMACPRDPGCWSFVGQTVAAVRLKLVGTYTIVSLTSKKAIPTPTGNYDDDLAAAKSAEAKDDRTYKIVH
jgi:hypothetical protein